MVIDMILVWAVAAAVFIVIELATYGIASIWFALGALCALVATVLGAPLWLQAVWFAFITAVTLLLTRPLVRKYINGRAQPTNADRVIGMEGVAVEAIDNLNGAGAVRVDGKIWSALSAGGEAIPTGTAVFVRAIRGVKLIVVPAPPPEAGPAQAPPAGIVPAPPEANPIQAPPVGVAPVPPAPPVPPAGTAPAPPAAETHTAEPAEPETVNNHPEE